MTGGAESSRRLSEEVFENGGSRRALYRDEDGLDSQVAHHTSRLGRKCPHHPLVIGCIGEDPVAIPVPPPHHDVIHDAPGLVQHQGVLGPPGADPGRVIGEEPE
jgi:hypothetical protein